jgi:hypothetical protein
MRQTRRRFTSLLQTGLAIAATGLRLAFLTGQSADFQAQGRELLNRRHFTPLVGSRFRAVSQSGERSSLRLLAVDDLTPGRQKSPQIECSLLRFLAEGASPPEGTYLVAHETAGQFLLHLNPGSSGRALAYVVHVPAAHLASVSIPRKHLNPAKTAATAGSEAA